MCVVAVHLYFARLDGVTMAQINQAVRRDMPMSATLPITPRAQISDLSHLIPTMLLEPTPGASNLTHHHVHNAAVVSSSPTFALDEYGSPAPGGAMLKPNKVGPAVLHRLSRVIDVRCTGLDPRAFRRLHQAPPTAGRHPHQYLRLA
jgi:hypothetical protein